MFDLANPSPKQVVRSDILYALGNLPRFTGHVTEYTVLEHSILVAELVEREHHDPYLTLTALYHDAHEAYTGDISTPMKNVLGREKVMLIEERIQHAIHEACNIPGISYEAYVDYIKPADEAILSFEYDQFFESNYSSAKTPGGLTLKYDKCSVAERAFRLSDDWARIEMQCKNLIHRAAVVHA
jgi:5'-deoxynucleotidase YfbR-like HD superfamily hydrolase